MAALAVLNSVKVLQLIYHSSTESVTAFSKVAKCLYNFLHVNESSLTALLALKISGKGLANL